MSTPADTGTILPTMDTLQRAVEALKPYATPAAIGAGTGAGVMGLAGLMGPKLRDPAARRSMLLRNIAMGGLFGGAAGAAFPMAKDILDETTPPKTPTVKALEQVSQAWAKPGASSPATHITLGTVGAQLPRLYNLVRGNTDIHKRLANTNVERLVGELNATFKNISDQVGTRVTDALSGGDKGKGKGGKNQNGNPQSGSGSALTEMAKLLTPANASALNQSSVSDYAERANLLRKLMTAQNAAADPGMLQVADKFRSLLPKHVLEGLNAVGISKGKPAVMRPLTAGEASSQQVLDYLLNRHVIPGDTKSLIEGARLGRWGNGSFSRASLRNLAPLEPGGPGWQSRFSNYRPASIGLGIAGALAPFGMQLLPQLASGVQTLNATVD